MKRLVPGDIVRLAKPMVQCHGGLMAEVVDYEHKGMVKLKLPWLDRPWDLWEYETFRLELVKESAARKELKERFLEELSPFTGLEATEAVLKDICSTVLRVVLEGPAENRAHRKDGPKRNSPKTAAQETTSNTKEESKVNTE